MELLNAEECKYEVANGVRIPQPWVEEVRRYYSRYGKVEQDGKGDTFYSLARTDKPGGARMRGEACNFDHFIYITTLFE